MSERAKAKIIYIGIVAADGTPSDWGFDAEGNENVIGVHYAEDGSLIAIGGWTPDELRAYAATETKEQR